MLIAPDILISQVIDEDEVITGKRREGLHYGFNNLVIRTSFVFYSATTATIFLLTGYDATLEVQQPAAVLGIRVLESIFPILAIVLSLVCLYIFPLHGKRWEDIEKKIAIIREKAFEETIFP